MSSFDNSPKSVAAKTGAIALALVTFSFSSFSPSQAAGEEGPPQASADLNLNNGAHQIDVTTRDGQATLTVAKEWSTAYFPAEKRGYENLIDLIGKESGHLTIARDGSFAFRSWREEKNFVSGKLPNEEMQNVLGVVAYNSASQFQRCFKPLENTFQVLALEKNWLVAQGTKLTSFQGIPALASTDDFVKIGTEILLKGGKLSFQPETGRITIVNNENKQVLQIASTENERSEALVRALLTAIEAPSSK